MPDGKLIINELLQYCDSLDENCPVILLSAISLLKKQDEVISALLEVGYPHNFQREEPWIRNYMYAITDVVKKAFEVKDDA